MEIYQKYVSAEIMLNPYVKLPVAPIAWPWRNFVNKTFVFHAQDTLIFVHVKNGKIHPSLLSLLNVQQQGTGMNQNGGIVAYISHFSFTSLSLVD